MVGFSREISSLMNFPLSKKSFFDEKKQIPTHLNFSSQTNKKVDKKLEYCQSLFFHQMNVSR